MKVVNALLQTHLQCILIIKMQCSCRLHEVLVLVGIFPRLNSKVTCSCATGVSEVSVDTPATVRYGDNVGLGLDTFSRVHFRAPVRVYSFSGFPFLFHVMKENIEWLAVSHR